MLARSGEIPDPCPVPRSLVVTTPSSRTPALSHLRIRRMKRGSPISCSTKRMSQSWPSIEEPGNIGVQNVVHLSAVDPDVERVQRIVLAAARAESVAEPEKFLLVDHIQKRRGGPWANLVLKGRDCQRALPPV